MFKIICVPNCAAVSVTFYCGVGSNPLLLTSCFNSLEHVTVDKVQRLNDCQCDIVSSGSCSIVSSGSCDIVSSGSCDIVSSGSCSI